MQRNNTTHHARRAARAFACLMILTVASVASARVSVEAYIGEPFGVGRVTVDTRANGAVIPSSDDRFDVVDANGRVLYPVLQNANVRRVVRQFLNIEIDAPGQVTIYFLFQGDAPLDLTVYAPVATPIQVRPTKQPRRFDRLLFAWWKGYTGNLNQLSRDGDYPIVVQSYLASTLSRRMNLRMPEMRRGILRNDPANEAIGLVFGTESIRAAIQKDLLLDTRPAGDEAANLPLPEPLIPPAFEFAPAPPETPVETIAMHVPHECFYIRYGNFSNYLWMRDFQSQWGGDLANMISVRGINYHANERIEQQLGLRQTALAKILGPTVISDVAIIGSDTFLREGAAVGILFEARNNALLGNDLTRQRKQAMARFDDATEETLTIGDQTVSYISTPDGSMRSYYVVDGDYHFVTTSRTLASRFLEAGDGDGSLGLSTEFQHARAVMPLERNDTIFAYLSDAFIRRMVSPHYRVEMTRRMRSLAEIDSVRLARLAAKAESIDAVTIPELIEADLLPPSFGVRPDGSRLLETEEGFVDTHRGMAGRFTPIPDVPVTSVTEAEAEAYDQFCKVYRGEWKRLDPVIAAVQRTPLGPEGLDRITIELLITPYHKPTFEQYTRYLGPPTHLARAPIAGDVGSLEVVTSGRLLAMFSGMPPESTHVFGGLRDFRFPFTVAQGRVSTTSTPPSVVRGYLGLHPRPGLLDAIVGGPEQVEFDAEGYAAPSGKGFVPFAWQRRHDGWGVLATNREVLSEVTPHLEMVEHPRPAQVRLRIESLDDKQISGLVNAYGYGRARDASASGSRFMNAIARQLRVPPQACREIAEELVDGTFQCALGGEYVIVESPDARPTWVSNALPPDNRFLLTEIPVDYVFPLFAWFRGVTAELSLVDDTLGAHIELDVQNAFNDATNQTASEPDTRPNLDDESAAPSDPEELPPPREN